MNTDRNKRMNKGNEIFGSITYSYYVDGDMIPTTTNPSFIGGLEAAFSNEFGPIDWHQPRQPASGVRAHLPEREPENVPVDPPTAPSIPTVPAVPAFIPKDKNGKPVNAPGAVNPPDLASYALWACAAIFLVATLASPIPGDEALGMLAIASASAML